jgi:hypothetical protein
VWGFTTIVGFSGPGGGRGGREETDGAGVGRGVVRRGASGADALAAAAFDAEAIAISVGAEVAGGGASGASGRMSMVERVELVDVVA